MADQLASFGTRRRKTHAIHDVVQASFQQAQQVFTRRAFQLGGTLVVVAELALEHPVHTTQFLLFTKLQTVVRQARPPLRRTARRHFEPALRLERPHATLEKQIRAFAAGQFALWS